MELDAVVLVDMDSSSVGNHKEPSPPPPDHEEPSPPAENNKYVYEQEVELEIETSLDDQLPIKSADSSNASSDATNETLSTFRSEQKLLTTTDGAIKKVCFKCVLHASIDNNQ